jgi:hypothetical protein
VPRAEECFEVFLWHANFSLVHEVKYGRQIVVVDTVEVDEGIAGMLVGPPQNGL